MLSNDELVDQILVSQRNDEDLELDELDEETTDDEEDEDDEEDDWDEEEDRLEEEYDDLDTEGMWDDDTSSDDSNLRENEF